MTEDQLTILKLLVEMDKFRSERILTLSVYRMKFSQYLEGQTGDMTAQEMVSFKKWDDMKIEERTQIAVEFLRYELVKMGERRS